MTAVPHSPHHQPYTRDCPACQRRRPWKGGLHVRVAGRQVFICRGCARELDAMRRRHDREVEQLRDRQRREVETLAEKMLYPLLASR